MEDPEPPQISPFMSVAKWYNDRQIASIIGLMRVSISLRMDPAWQGFVNFCRFMAGKTGIIIYV